MKSLLLKGFGLLICIASLLMLFGFNACTRYEGSPGCFNRPPADYAEQAQEITDKAKETTEGLVEEGKQKLEEVTDKLPNSETTVDKPPAETPAATPTKPEPEPESTPQATEEGCWLEGKWKIAVRGDEKEFTNKDGEYFGCNPFDIMFQIRDWQVERMYSPMFGYISEDYAAGTGKVTFKRDGYLEVTIPQGDIRHEFRGWLNEAGDGSGSWESFLILDGKEHEDCWGKWQAVRTGELSE